MFTDTFLVLFTSEQSGWWDFTDVAVDDTGQQSLSELPYPLTLETKSHINLELTKFARLTGRPSPQNHPASTSQCWDYMCISPYLVLSIRCWRWKLGSLLVLCLTAWGISFVNVIFTFRPVFNSKFYFSSFDSQSFGPGKGYKEIVPFSFLLDACRSVMSCSFLGIPGMLLCKGALESVCSGKSKLTRKLRNVFGRPGVSC